MIRYQSTLLNALVGQKVSIATSKAQTTRRETLGVFTESNVQLVRDTRTMLQMCTCAHGETSTPMTIRLDLALVVCRSPAALAGIL